MAESKPGDLARTGLRNRAGQIVVGVAGVGTLAILAASSLVPLIGPLVAGSLTAPVVAGWLGGLGGNALANWLDTWARSTVARATGDDSATDEEILASLAADLQQQIERGGDIADGVASLLRETDAVATTLDALRTDAAAQTQLLEQLARDLQDEGIRNEHLHAQTQQAVLLHTERLRDALAQSEERLHTKLDTLLATVRTMRPVVHQSGVFIYPEDQSFVVPPGLPNPFRALEAFRQEDAPLFFGRGALIDEGQQAWTSSDRRFLAVVGASGSGKSSLAQAGLLPRFQRDLAELGYSATVIIVRPGEYPLRALRDALRRQRIAVPTDFVDRIAHEPDLLTTLLQAHNAISPLLPVSPRAGGTKGETGAEQESRATLLLLLDQFEELFTLCRDEDEQAAFDAALTYAIEQGGEAVSVLLTLRSDFYRHTAELGLRRHIQTAQVIVRHLKPEEMAQAITAPVRQVAGDGPPQFAAGLVEQMVEETGTSPGALPLLEFTLSRLWEHGTLDLDTYRRLEGVRGALNQQAEETYKALSREERKDTRYLLLQLVQLGEGNEDTRRRVPLTELTPAGRDPAQTAALVQRLAAARLLTTTSSLTNGNTEAAEAVVEVSHEALIRDWQRLRGWLEEDREAVRLHRQIGEAAKLWQASEMDSSHLWTGARLASAEEWSAQLTERLTAQEQAFLAASGARQRRNRLTTGVGILAIIGVLVLGSLASVIWQQSRQIADERDSARDAESTAVVAQGTAVAAQEQVAQLQRETLSRRLAAESQAIRGEQPDFALALGIQALRVAETYEADDAVRSWFDESLNSDEPLYSVDSALFHEGPVYVAQWNVDETRILTWSADSTVKLWAAEGTLLAIFNHDGEVWGATWNADESRILTWSDDGTAKVWDAEGDLLATLAHDAVVWAASWNADESRILTWSRDNSAKVWDAEGGLLTIFNHDGEVWGATWSDDGTAKVWDAEGSLLATLDHDSWVQGAMWNAEESRILTWSEGGTAELWDVEGNHLATLNHEGEISGVTWDANGNRILTSSWDGAAKLWDAEGNRLATLNHDPGVSGAMWNTEESHILTWSVDGTAKIHYARSADLLEPACRAASRNMLLDEWRNYMGVLPYRRTCTRPPLHRSYREDVAARLESGELDEEAAIAEVARALSVDAEPTAEEVAQYEAEAREIVGEMRR